MTVEQAVLETLRGLPPDKKQAVLDFAQFLKSRAAGQGPRPTIQGLCADLSVRITDEDIAEARKEMWGTFPREDVP